MILKKLIKKIDQMLLVHSLYLLILHNMVPYRSFDMKKMNKKKKTKMKKRMIMMMDLMKLINIIEYFMMLLNY